MESFLKEDIEGVKFELTIDTKIFYADIVLKSTFQHLEKGYFFFRSGENNSIILQFTPKEGVDIAPEKIIGDFSDTLLETTLRDKLEKDNKTIRETIVAKAIHGPLDPANFISLDTSLDDEPASTHSEKNIDEVMQEIKNDPDLQINENEIKKAFEEAEKKGLEAMKKPQVDIDMQGLKNAKANFKK